MSTDFSFEHRNKKRSILLRFSLFRIIYEKTLRRFSEESNGNCAGANVGSDYASNAGFTKVFNLSFPDETAVLFIFFEHIGVMAGVAKKNGH